MSKKRIDFDKALEELSESVKKKKPSPQPSPETLLLELESSVNFNKTKSKPPPRENFKTTTCRQKDELGYQIQKDTKPIPKKRYSKYLYFDYFNPWYICTSFLVHLLSLILNRLCFVLGESCQSKCYHAMSLISAIYDLV